MKRPMLISGITMAVSCVFLMLYSKVAAYAMLLFAASAFVLYLIKPLKLRKYIIIPTVCISTLLISLSFLSYTHVKIEPCLQYDSQITYVAGKIVTTPVTKNGYTSFVLETDKISNNSENIKIDIIIPQESSTDIRLYDYISMDSVRLSVPKDEHNEPDFSYASDGILLSGSGSNLNFLWHCEKTPYYYCLHFKEIINNRIDAFMSDDTAGILKGMLFGGSGSINSNTRIAFKNSGISHLLAVSGLHTSLWCGLLISVLKLLRIPEKICNAICIVFLVAFCTISAFTPSVVRSSLMMFILLISIYFKRRPDSLNSLGFAAVLLLLPNPYIILNISFQLSTTATLGVLLASKYETITRQKTHFISSKPLKAVVDYTLTSLLVSSFAGVFTMPVSAYYFNVFSLMSPITNVLCVKLAFYGMLSGCIATASSFIENSFIRNITIFIYDITEFILNIVRNISVSLSNFKYCTIPIHKQWLIFAMICTAIIIAVSYCIYKAKKKPAIIKIAAVVCVFAVCVNISIPLIPGRYYNTLSVISSGNDLHIVIRSGTHYAYIVNSTETFSSDVYDYLPKATCESLDYYLLNYISYNSVRDIKAITSVCKPLETHITPSINYLCESTGIDLPRNTIISVTGKYILNDKISVEIVDTYPTQYAIIKGERKTAYVHLHGDTNLSDVVDVSDGDIFVYNGVMPDKTSEKAEFIIINADSEIIRNKSYYELKSDFPNLHLTAKDGDYQIII